MLDHLIAARKSGAGVRRLAWLVFWGERAVGYAEACGKGIPDREVVEAVNDGVFLSDYSKAREVAAHREILQAHTATGDVFGYACHRAWGEDHEAALEEVRAGASGRMQAPLRCERQTMAAFRPTMSRRAREVEVPR
ncbi:hypothetical protein [Actinomadura sp. NPDC048394]|uniref:hypothetical protein n=1 Tax=Actinomadura sp. NPDC048394 TaxID=3158223 RepID=UPI0033E08FF6